MGVSTITHLNSPASRTRTSRSLYVFRDGMASTDIRRPRQKNQNPGEEESATCLRKFSSEEEIEVENRKGTEATKSPAENFRVSRGLERILSFSRGRSQEGEAIPSRKIGTKSYRTTHPPGREARKSLTPRRVLQSKTRSENQPNHNHLLKYIFKYHKPTG